MKAWSEMTSRERDALVAEKVMGWHRCDDVHCDGCDCPVMTVGMDEIYIRHPGTGLLGWSPTQSIAAAWEVVEKMDADGWSLHLSNISHHEYRYRADLRDTARPFKAEGHVVAGGVSAPDAICRCALRAMGIDV